MAGYSDTPLWKKLGYETGLTSYVDGAPSQYLSMLFLPDDVEVAWLNSPESNMKFVHLFAVDASGFRKKLHLYRRKIAPDGVIWVSWPKKSSNVATDITENVIREAALPIGLVDIKVCAVDEVWSGLKLMIRKSNDEGILLRTDDKTFAPNQVANLVEQFGLFRAAWTDKLTAMSGILPAFPNSRWAYSNLFFARMTPQEVAQQFVIAINAHDVECLATLMTSDHRFIDSLGTVVEGRDAMREGWRFYFAMVCDYHLEISRCFSAEAAKDETILVGVASGSYWSNGLKRPNSGWSTPAALRAVVRDGQIAEWQVYADNEPIRQQMRVASV